MDRQVRQIDRGLHDRSETSPGGTDGHGDHVYSVYIKATADRIWRAITDGDETVRYYYGTRVDSSWEVGAPITYTYPDGSVAANDPCSRSSPAGGS